MDSYNYGQASMDLLGQPKGRKGNELNYFNPLAKDGKNPDFYINIGTGAYNSFSTGHRGHLTDLYAKLKGIDTKAAFKELIEKYPVNGNSPTFQKPKNGKDYGFVYNKIRVVPDLEKKIIECLTLRHIQKDYSGFLIKAGLVKYDANPKYTPGLVVPVFNSKDPKKVIAFQKIPYDFKGAKQFRGPFKSGGPGFWKTPDGWKTTQDQKTLYVVESFVNALSLGIHGHKACCTFSANNVEFAREFFNSYEKVVICFDNDSEGKAGAVKLAQIIGIDKSLILVWPKGTPKKWDINDLLKKSPDSFESEFKALLKNIKPAKEFTKSQTEETDYLIKNSSYFYMKTTEKRTVLVKVSNFIIDIEKEIEISDGYEKKRVLEGKIKGSGFARAFSIEAKVFFNNTKLQETIGDQAGTMAQFRPPDLTHIRLASLQLSKVKQESVLMQFGWKDDDTFLTPSVIVTKDGIKENTEIKVDLSTAENAKNLDLQILNDELFKEVAGHIIKDLLTLQPCDITYPLIGHTFIATVMCFLSDTNRYILWLKGVTGCGKSFIARLFQCFFGYFIEDSSITSWTSTTNFIQMVGFYFKDSAFLVDDFKRGNIKDRNDLIQKLQSYADGTARGRLNADSSTKQTRPIRGLMFATGEDVPEYEASILARTLIIECKNQPKKIGQGSKCSQHRKNYSGVMARFIHWCLKNNIKDSLNGFVQKCTENFYAGIAGQQNDIRIARNLALNFTGFSLFCNFMQDAGIITKEVQKQMVEESQKILFVIRDRQIQTVKSEQASNIFLNTLSDLISTGRAAIHNPNMTRWVGQTQEAIEPEDLRNMVGFTKKDDGVFVYINPTAAFLEVQKAVSQSGGTLNFSKDAIGKQLIDDGIVEQLDKGRNQKTVKYRNKICRVWPIKKEKLGFEDEN